MSSQTYNYRILKTLSSLKIFTQTLEQQLGFPLPISLVTPPPAKTNQNQLQANMSFMNLFFKAILGNKNYFCKELFDFVCFDVFSRQEKQFSTRPSII